MHTCLVCKHEDNPKRYRPDIFVIFAGKWKASLA